MGVESSLSLRERVGVRVNPPPLIVDPSVGARRGERNSRAAPGLPAQFAGMGGGYLSITTVAGLLKLLPQYGCHSVIVGSFTQKLLTVATAALMCQ